LVLYDHNYFYDICHPNLCPDTKDSDRNNQYITQKFKYHKMIKIDSDLIIL